MGLGIKTRLKRAYSKGRQTQQLALAQLAEAVGLKYPRYCPVCRRPAKKFLSRGLIPRPDAQCPYCGALERHRLDWVFFHTKTNLFDGKPKTMLHFAPERAFQGKLRHIPNLTYVSADLLVGRADVALDITQLPFRDDAFAIIYCSHVLEHVPDDRKAMRELHRVLHPAGWAVLQVPITAERTYEDPSITDPKERERVFGQHDHVRRYGPDYVDRLEEAGFKVTIFDTEDIIESPSLINRYAVANWKIYYCQKRN